MLPVDLYFRLVCTSGWFCELKITSVHPILNTNYLRMLNYYYILLLLKHLRTFGISPKIRLSYKNRVYPFGKCCHCSTIALLLSINRQWRIVFASTEKSVAVHLTAADYLTRMAADNCVRVFIKSKVTETGQSFATMETVEFQKPELEAYVSAKTKILEALYI